MTLVPKLVLSVFLTAYAIVGAVWALVADHTVTGVIATAFTVLLAQWAYKLARIALQMLANTPESVEVN